jgi:hypothetical protein
MLMTYEILEKCTDGKLIFVESAQSLEQAKLRFFFLSLSSQREYLVWDLARRHEVVLRAVGHA